jgi:2-polyprenyl-3-methyl-5-hydroxy-6-metoxy-1,4-benzoquinol methylase
MTDEQTTAYYAGMYRTSLTERVTDFMEKDTRLQKSRAEAEMPFIKGVFGRNLTKPNIFKVIDIGCSLGYLLDELDYDDTECEGVEPDTRYHGYSPANQFPMYARVDDIPEGKTYDLITFSHSLEHLNRPREFLTDLLSKHANQDTIVMVDVPNTETHRGAYRIHHPYAFTPFTLQGLFSRIGWATVQMSFYGLEQEGPERKYMIGFFARAK